MLMAVTTATAGTETSIEAKLASLMGTTVYVDSRGYSFYADSDGKIKYKEKSVSPSTFSDDFNFKADGVDYVAGNKYVSQLTFRFVVEKGKLTKIVDESNPKSYEYLPKQNTPSAITAPAAEKTQKAVKVIENGQIVIIKGDKKYDLTGRKM